MPNQSPAAKMRTFLGCLAGVVGFFAAGFFLLIWAAQSARYEETHGQNYVTSPDGKHVAGLRKGQEYFHDSLVLDDQTIAASRTLCLFDLRWNGPKTLVVRYLPSGLPNMTNGPVQFDEQVHNVGDVHIDYVLISRAEADKETYGVTKKTKPPKVKQKKPVP